MKKEKERGGGRKDGMKKVWEEKKEKFISACKEARVVGGNWGQWGRADHTGGAISV